MKCFLKFKLKIAFKVVAKYDMTGFTNKSAEDILTTFNANEQKTETKMDEATMKNWFTEIKNLIIL